MARSKPKLVHTSNMPSLEQLLNIKLADTHEFELTDKETKATRARIYALNRENDAYRWRTIREFPLLLIWKLRKRA